MAVPAIPGGAGPLNLSGGAGGNAGPSTARSGDAMFDNGGWTVTFGDNSPATPATGLGGYMPFVLMAIGGLVLWKTLRK